MAFDQRLQSGAIEGPGCDLEDRPFAFVHGRSKVVSVQAKEREHGANALVAINKSYQHRSEVRFPPASAIYSIVPDSRVQG